MLAVFSVAHSFAIVGFILLILGPFGVYLRLQFTRSERLALIGLVLSWIGAGLVLPFYGAEVFGLHAIGQEAMKDNNGGRTLYRTVRKRRSS